MAGGPQGRIAIAVMAKAPQPGRSKTRLVPPLDAKGAAALSAAFLCDMTNNIALAAREMAVAGCVAYAPAGQEALFAGVLAPGTFLLLADGSPAMPPRVQGFGRCLLHAIRSLLATGYIGACVLNSDSPTLPTDYLRRAAAALARPGDRAVLGPAEDGGYYLLGLKHPHAHLFEDVAWSTERVAEQTRARADAIGLELVDLPVWYDVDNKFALRRLVKEIAAPSSAPTPYPAPATACCARTLGIAELLAATA